jgi:hypothetical protein
MAAARCRLTWDDHGMTLEKARKAESEQARKDRKRADENNHGGIHVDDDRRVERATGNSSKALRRRLARHAPGLLAAWERGEFRSVRAAAIAAGLIRPLNGLDRLQRDWRIATPAERAAFEEWKREQDP